MKTCSKCKRHLESTMFYAQTKAKDGLSSWCKTCTQDQQRDYHKRWYEANKETKLAKSKEWAKQNPELIKKHQTRYRHLHPEYDLNKKSRRRERIRMTSFFVSTREIQAMKQKPCLYCGSKSSHIDHIVPLSRGGQHRIGNLAPACRRCNISKNDKFITEWRIKQ